MELKTFTVGDELIASFRPQFLQRAFQVFGNFRGGEHPSGKTGRHVERAVDEIPQIICELAIIAHDKLFAGEVAILTDVHLAHQEVAKGVRAEFRDQIQRVERIARAFRHFGAALHPPTMRNNSARQRQLRRMQHNGPVNCMRRNENIFADDMPGCWPLARMISDRRIVIKQRIKPHISDIIGIKRERDTPLESLART